MNASDKHNQLAKEFVKMAGIETRSQEELLVVIESSILATMHLLTKMYGVKKSHASIFLESALQNATERFNESAK